MMVVTSFRQKLLLIAFGVGLLVVILALVEGALALLGLGDAHLYDDPFVGFAPGKELFEKKTMASGETMAGGETMVGDETVYSTRPEKLRFFNHQQFPADKAPGTYRIFALGGSTTAGRPYDDKVAFCRWLELYLEAMDPSRDWQAINAGAISYASYRIVVLIKELVRYQPDLFVIYTGHNEFLEERSYSDIIHQNPVLKRLRFWLSSRRFYALARHAVLALGAEPEAPGPALASPALAPEVSARLDGWTGLELYHRDDQLRRSVIEHFEYNLKQMVAIARAHGVGVVLVKPISNLKDFSPFKSEHRADLSPADVAAFDALLSDGRARLAAGDEAAALEAFGKALDLDPEHAGIHFWTGRARLALGEHAAAREAFVRAKDLDVAPLRALERISELIEETAVREGLALVDLPAILAADSKMSPLRGASETIPGNELLLDHVHPDAATHSLIAEQVIETLVDSGVAHRDASWTAARRQAIFDGLIARLDPSYYAERDLNLAKVLGWAGKLEEAEAPLVRAAAVIPDNPKVHFHLGVIYQRTGRLEAAADELRQALGLDPGSAEARFNLGVVYGRLGRIDAAVADLEQAIRLRGDYPEAYHNLGVLLRRRGSSGDAVAALERAIELKPDATESHGQLALALRDQGRFDDAVASFLRALELDPSDPAMRTALGVTYGRRGRTAQALEELRKVVASRPDFAEAHYNLGVVHSEQGDDEAALAAYLETVEVDPEHTEAHNNLGILYAGRGELETARRYLVQAIEIDGEYADAYFNLGVVYDNAGYPDQASQVLSRAVELVPENPRFHFALAMMHFAGGRPAAARRHFVAARAGGIETPAEIRRELEATEKD